MKRVIPAILLLLLISPPGFPGSEEISSLLDQAAATYTSAPDECIGYCNRVLKLAEREKNPAARAKALIYLSYAHSVLGEWEKPFDYSKEALAIYEELENERGIGKALFTIGYLYREINYFNLALDYTLRSLKVFEEIGIKQDLFFPYYNLGGLYENLQDYQKALEYFQKALDTVKDIKDSEQIPTCLNNIGFCYLRKGDYVKALDHFQRALKLFNQTDNAYWTAAALSNIGWVHVDLGDREQALRYLSQALQKQEKIGDRIGGFHTLCLLGDTFRQEKDFSRAFFYYDKAFHVARELKDKYILAEIYEKYAGCYGEMGDFKNAFEYQKEYGKTRELLFVQQKDKQLAELEIQFETEKQTKEIEILKKNNKIQTLTRNTFITGFILVSIILALLFRKYLHLFAFWKKQKYIGQYHLKEIIGSGGMGTVYLAHSILEKNRLSAVKVLKEELVEDESSRKRFKQEGTIIDKVSHPNIVRVFERGEHKGKLYIAMEYLQGETLAQKIKKDGKIDLRECVFIMEQVAEALTFIHEKNIVHRDLKPANIMLVEEKDAPGVVKLLDFGVALAKFQTRLTQAGMLVGTIHYVAPEQIMENFYSPAGDVYAMGMIFYEMLTGKPAFSQDTFTAVVEKILADPPQPVDQLLPGVPGELSRLISQLLSKDPGQRPSAAEVSTRLKKIFVGPGVLETTRMV